MASYRLGVDVGGTNTDLVLYDESSGMQLVEKLPSTPSNPAAAVLEGIHRFVAAWRIARRDRFFRARYDGNHQRAAWSSRASTLGYSLPRATPVSSTCRRRPAPATCSTTRSSGRNPWYRGNSSAKSRVVSTAGEWRSPHSTALPSGPARKQLAKQGIRSFAICYIFSFMNPAHERATAEIIRSVVPDATISMSSSVMPRIREWPRFSTTMLNAYLEPILVRYIDDLSKGLDKLGVQRAQRFLMQSNGGVMPFSGVAAGGNTVHTLLSGPAAGVQGSCHLLSATGQFGNLITMDIGGTSCDIAFIEGGRPLEISECSIEGRQVDVPSLDIITIPAGGGTIARVDRGGFLVVGPESAGAVPGPACFDRGGTLPTITDAYIVCGLLSEGGFLGGSQKIDAAAAHRAIETHLARPLGLSVVQAASGMLRIVNARIADEIRLQAAKKGVELSKFTLVAFGGAGPVHAAAVAEELGIATFLVPFSPGAFSALGLLCSDIIHDFLRSDLTELGKLTPQTIERHFADLKDEAAAALAAEVAEAGRMRVLA